MLGGGTIGVPGGETHFEQCVAIDDSTLGIECKFGRMLQVHPNGTVEIRRVLTAQQISYCMGNGSLCHEKELVDTFDVLQVPQSCVLGLVRLVSRQDILENKANAARDPDAFFISRYYVPQRGLMDTQDVARLETELRLRALSGACSQPMHGQGFPFFSLPYGVPPFGSPGPLLPPGQGPPMPVSCPADDADANAAALLLHAASAGADMAKHSAGAGSSQPSGGFSIHSRGAGMGAGAGAVPLRPTPKHHVPSRTIQSIISTLSRNSANRGGPEMAQSLTGALATLESHLPATVMVPAWGQRRSSWLNKGKSARTIRDVATCLVDLDDAIAIPVRGATRGAAERKGWAMRMLNLHTYQTVSASVVSYLRDIEAAVAASGQCLIERCAPGPAAAATPETSDHHVPRPASAMSARSGPADGSGAAEEPALGRIGSVLASTRPAEATGRAPAGGSAAQGPDEAAVTPAGAEAREEAMKTPPPGTSVISGATRDGGVGAGASGETPAGGAGTEASTEPRGNGEGAAFVPRRGHKKMRLTETTPRPAYASGVGDSGREGSGRSPASGAARSRGTEERDEHVLSLPKDLRTRWSKERYETAQRSLMDVMTNIGATSSERAVLRPALREEARKVVGDTGLLDHLLRHMPDSSIINGKVVRRVHDQQGHMVYWIEAADQTTIRFRDMGSAPDVNEARQMRSMIVKLKQEAQGVMQQYREVGDLGQLQAEAQMAHEATRKELEDFRREMRALSAEARAGAEEVVAQLKGRLETVLSREAALAARIEEVWQAVRRRAEEASSKEAAIMSRLDRLEQHFDAAETRLVREFKGGRGLVRPAVAGAGVGEGPGARGADEVAELRAQVEALSKQLVSLQEQVQGRGGSAVASPTLANGGTRVGDMTPAPLGREKAGGSTPRTALVGSHKTVA